MFILFKYVVNNLKAIPKKIVECAAFNYWFKTEQALVKNKVGDESKLFHLMLKCTSRCVFLSKDPII